MSAESADRNKRQHDRVRVTSSKRVWDLSEGGAYVASDNPKKAGAVIHFELKLDSAAGSVKALAKVVRVHYKPNPRTGEPAGMALQFIRMEDGDREALRQYLARQKEIRQAVETEKGFK